MALEDHADRLLDLLDSTTAPALTGVATVTGQVPVYSSVTGLYTGTSVAAATGVTVPQPHEAAVSAPAAATSSQNGTTDATDLPSSEALANALKVSYNAAQVDIAALCASNTALIADVLTLNEADRHARVSTPDGVGSQR